MGLRDLCEKILDIFEESHKNERMITSMLAFLDRLLSSGCIQSVLDDESNTISERILTLLKQEIKYSNNMKLLISSINVFCELLQVKIDEKNNTGKQDFIVFILFLKALQLFLKHIFY